MIQPIRQTFNIAITGAKGRIGKKLIPNLEKHYNIYPIIRGEADQANKASKDIVILDPSSLTVKEWKKTLEDNNIHLVLNLAVQSSGKYRSMKGVNVTMPTTIAEACAQAGIQMVHTCSHSVHISGLDKSTTPYAFSKKEAADELEKMSGVVTARFNAVVGSESEGQPVCSDAAISTWSPIVILPAEDGGDLIFHPVDEATVIEGLKRIIDHITDPSKKDQPLRRVIDIAGKPVSLKKFLKMVNPNALAGVKLPEAVFSLLTKLVDKGVFSKEFLHLSKLLKAEGGKTVEPDLSTMEDVLGLPAPSLETVAAAAREQLSLAKTTSTIVKSFFKRLPNITAQTVKRSHWPINFVEQVKAVKQLYQSKVYDAQR